MKGKFKTIKEIQKEMDKITNECSPLEVSFSVGLKHTELFAMSKQTKQICEMIEEKMNEYDKYYLKAHDKKEKHQEDIFYSTYSELKKLLSKIRGADGGRN